RKARRTMVVRAAVRIERAGSLASAAVMDSSSMPPKENITTDSAIHTGAQPMGAKPPSAVHSTRPGAGWPGIPTNTRIAPIRMNTNTAITLIEDRKNSITPKDPTLARLMPTISAANSRMPAQLGSQGAQQPRQAAQATSLAPVTQPGATQYRHRERYRQTGER